MLALAWFELASVILGIIIPILAVPSFFWLLSIGAPFGGAIGGPVISVLLMFLSFMIMMLVETFRMDNVNGQRVRTAEQTAIIKIALKFGGVKLADGKITSGGVKLGSLIQTNGTRYGLEIQLPEKPLDPNLWGQRLNVASGYDLLIEPSPGKRVVLERMWLYILARLSHPFKRPQEGLGAMFLQRGSEAKSLYGVFDIKTYSELTEAELPVGEIAKAYDPGVPLSMLAEMYEPVEYSWEYATGKESSPSRWHLLVKRSKRVAA
jgi:hypothetical protein